MPTIDISNPPYAQENGLRFKPNYTHHATKQLNRRGIKKDLVEVITLHGDREIRVGNNIIALSISEGKLSELLVDSVVQPSQISTLSKIVVLLAEYDFQVITAFPRYGKKARHYQHDIKYVRPH